MIETCCCGIQVGQPVPDFKLETFEPTKGDFGEISLEALKKKNGQYCSSIPPRSHLSEQPSSPLWQSGTTGSKRWARRLLR